MKLTLRHATLSAAALLAGATVLGACGVLDGNPGQAFDHKQFFIVSGSHADFSCDKCHDPNASSFAEAKKGVDCLGCHQQPPCDAAHGAMAGYAYDAQSCANCIQCHKDGTGGLPANHPFPVAAGTPHAGISCSKCHGATKAKADLLCNTCHGGVSALNASHSGISGYSSASPACYDCHSDGKATINHAALTRFPITHGNARTCSDCHGATRAAADLKCYSCHDAPSDHNRRSGFVRGDSAGCYRCHPTGQGGD